jgi:hypothetical protein
MALDLQPVTSSQLDLQPLQPGVVTEDIRRKPQSLLGKQPERVGLEALAKSPAIGFGVGFIKGGLETLKGAGELGERGIRGLGRLVTPKRFEKRLGFSPDRPTGAEQIFPTEEALAPKTKSESVGKFVERLGEFLVPGTKIAKASKGLPVLARATLEGLTAAGVTSLQEGKIGKETAVSGVLGASIPLAGGAVKKAFRPERLISKALGLTPTQKKNITKLAQTKFKGKSIYKDVDDFALKKGLKGSREEMLEQVKELFKKSTESKAIVLENVKTKTPNRFGELFEVLLKEYDVPGQKDVLKKINDLSVKKTLTAIELDDIRGFTDAVLPKSAYLDATPVKTKGMQKLVDPIRRTLEKVDETGTIKQANTDIRVLFKLTDNLDQSSKRVLANQVFFRTAGRVLAGGGVTAVIPGALPFAVATGVAEAITDIPQFASGLAQTLKGLSENQAAIVLGNILKATSQAGIK